MADGSGFLSKIADFIKGPREPSEKELAARGLADEGIDPDKAFGQYETDLTLQYLTTIGADFTPSDIRNLLIRARWGDPRWLYSIYDMMPRLGPGPQMRKMIEAVRDTEDQYLTTPEDADPDASEEDEQYTPQQLALAVELDRELPIGAPVVLIGHGMLAEEHARVAGTITYELVCGINSNPARARRVVVDA